MVLPQHEPETAAHVGPPRRPLPLRIGALAGTGIGPLSPHVMTALGAAMMRQPREVAAIMRGLTGRPPITLEMLRGLHATPALAALVLNELPRGLLTRHLLQQKD